ncbi:GspE/PulE family protein [Roseiconus lacunae]|uniref:GspE/PulE family protein n=1 Tax=Roseiconus lacunae TaxID=2605694 RepID=UPI001E455DC6|nr:type II/IV secretion system protein [Roseiconus lacunae]MCD0461070.1 Flp pilus assembly complex ATPase component TadA [Roseiconus lacunae]
MKAATNYSNETIHGKRQPLILQLLNRVEAFTPESLEELWQSVEQYDTTLEELIIRSGLANETQIAQCYSEHYLVPLFDPPDDTPPPIDPSIASSLPVRLCCEHMIAPLHDDGSLLEVAVFSPDSLLLADEIRSQTGRQMRPMFAPLSVIERILTTLYAPSDDVDSLLNKSSDGLGVGVMAPQDRAPLLSHTRRNPEPNHGVPDGRDHRITRYIHTLFEQALQCNASDIHIEPSDTGCRVRLRIDGVLAEIPSPPFGTLPIAMQGKVINHLKALGRMDLDECRRPQDGTIVLQSGNNRIDLRVNSCPTVYGEKIVLRVVNQSAPSHDLERLELDRRQYTDLVESIRSPSGLILMSGPAGNGKSTTMYSCLKYLNDSQANLCTVEDPVQIKIEGINQVQAEPELGLTYSHVIEALLRQDPDIIMVGELADQETAKTCLKAATAGHLVLSTLQTSDAISSLARFDEWGIERSRLADQLRLVVSQRLIRRLCDGCKTVDSLDAAYRQRYRIPADVPIYRAVGCSDCRQTGYRGRFATFEVIRMTSRLKDLIRTNASPDTVKHAVTQEGMKTIARGALASVIEGTTSLQEAIRVCSDCQ